MDHTRRIRVGIASVFIGSLCACGGGDTSQPAGPSGASPAGAGSAVDGTPGASAGNPADDGSGNVGSADDGSANDGSTDSRNAPLLQLSIDGRDEPMGARAQLDVEEGTQPVKLEIAGSDGGNDYLILDLQFDGVGSSLGQHSISVGLPDSGSDTASANLAGLPYHAQQGQVELTLSGDGTISGTFQLGLARDPDTSPGQQVTFTPTDELWSVSGSFSGAWVLDCNSLLPGHYQVTRPGGEYCDKLQL